MSLNVSHHVSVMQDANYARERMSMNNQKPRHQQYANDACSSRPMKDRVMHHRNKYHTTSSLTLHSTRVGTSRAVPQQHLPGAPLDATSFLERACPTCSDIVHGVDKSRGDGREPSVLSVQLLWRHCRNARRLGGIIFSCVEIITQVEPSTLACAIGVVRRRCVADGFGGATV